MLILCFVLSFILITIHEIRSKEKPTESNKRVSARIQRKRKFNRIRQKRKKKANLMGEARTCLKVSSEIYAETNFRSSKSQDGMTISHFSFYYPAELPIETSIKSQLQNPVIDNDGDLIVERKRRGVIKIAHQDSTELSLVGLQVWRGALLLADFLFHNRRKFANLCILELGSGVGLTSIAGGIFAESDITCTDIELGGILKVIQSNVDLNKNLIHNRANISVMELDFKKSVWPDDLKEAVSGAKIIIAADVIYDNDITDCFIKTLQRILDPNGLNQLKDKEVYIAMEKRYVFTLAELDTMAPCYEYFLQRIDETRKTINWKLEPVDCSFPQYFDYERSKELIIMKLYI